MNWKEIQKEWDAGRYEIAIKLLKVLIYESRFRQKRLSEFIGTPYQPLGAMVETLELGPESSSGKCNKTLTGQPVPFVVIKPRDLQQGIFTGGDGHD